MIKLQILRNNIREYIYQFRNLNLTLAYLFAFDNFNDPNGH